MPMLAPSPTRYLHHITRHIERHIGPSPMVFHEIVSADIHLDVHIVPPVKMPPSPQHPFGRNFYTLVTSGMSTRPLEGPADGATRLMELMISLPADWPGLRHDGTFIQEYMSHEEHWWPIRWLKMLARQPYEGGQGINIGDTVPNGATGEPFASNTTLGCMMLAPSLLHPQAQSLVVHDDVSIEFLALWPIHVREMEFKSQHGAEALLARLLDNRITDLLNPERAPVV